MMIDAETIRRTLERPYYCADCPLKAPRTGLRGVWRLERRDARMLTFRLWQFDSHLATWIAHATTSTYTLSERGFWS